MIWSRKRKAALSATVVAIMAASFVVSDALFDAGASSAEEDGAADAEQIWHVSTAEEASEIAGYPVATPAFIPDGFEPGGNIVVAQPPVESLPRRVIQTWSSSDGSARLSLIQDPTLDGIGGADTTAWGISGEMAFYERGDRPDLLAFYWRDGDMAYSLVGTLTKPLDRAVLERIAFSVSAE